MLPKFVADRLAAAMTPQPVAPTPGVNAPVAQPAPAPHDEAPLPPGHWLDDAISGRADVMTAMFDPGVVKDRMQAEKELAGRFQIDDKTKGARLPNQVTTAEFHKLANTYSDIRLGRGDLTVDATGSKDPAQYRADIMNDVGDIMQTKSGRTLVEGLSSSTNLDENGDLVHRHTKLTPGLDEHGDPDPGATDENGAVNAFGKGHLNLDGTPGVGTDAVIRSNPNMDITEQDSTGATVGRIRSDVALFHEMVHAYTDTRGFTANGQVSPDDGLVSAAPLGAIHLQDPNVVADASSGWPVAHDEYQAAGLGLYHGDLLTENTYRSERNDVAKSGKGIAGDLLMPQRTQYMGVDDYQTIGGR